MPDSPVRISTYEAGRNKNPWYDSHLAMLEQYAKPLRPPVEHMGAIMAPLINTYIRLSPGTISLGSADRAYAEIETVMNRNPMCGG